ncbi:hypothetical protein BsWGS_15628 [Bradybaena similaris]
MNLNITSIVNETLEIPVKFHRASTRLDFGPAWVWIGAVVAILFVVVCVMWVISRQLGSKDYDEEATGPVHRLGQPTIGANFIYPLVNLKAPGLTTGFHNFSPVTSTDRTFDCIDNKKPLLSNKDIYSV